jgi:hypothetical protein
MKTIKALMIDPAKRAVRKIELPVTPPEPGDAHGPQVGLDQLYRLLGCKLIDMFGMPNGRDVAVIDDEGLHHTQHFFSARPGLPPHSRQMHHRRARSQDR